MTELFESLTKKIDTQIKKEQIIDLYYFVELISKSDLTTEDKLILIKKLYSYNLTLVKKTESKVLELSKISDSNNKIADIKLDFSNDNIYTKEKSKLNVNKFNNIDISNYVKLIDSFKEDIEFEILNDLIPEAEFENIINRIIAYYTLDYITLQKLINSEKNCDLYEADKLKYDFIICNLKIIRDSKQPDDCNLKNSLIYLQTAYGNNNFLNELSKISQEYYDYISLAFSSIQNGTFKNMKSIGRNVEGFDLPLLQVRVDDIRIFFNKIAANLYLINGVIVKKFTTSKSYSSYIRKLSNVACLQRKNFLKMSAEEKDLIINDGIETTNTINKMLGVKKKVLK